MMDRFSKSQCRDKVIGNRIKALRTMRGLTQGEFGEQLAESIGRTSPFTVPYISALETGRKYPAPVLRKELGEFFEIDDQIFEDPHRKPLFKPERLRSVREQQGISQRKLIRKMSEIRGKSYNPNYISLLERGKTSPSRIAAEQIAEVLGIQANELYST